MTNIKNINDGKWTITNWPTFIVNFITLITVGVYTCYSRQQVTESQIANSIAKEALGEVNKPYVMSSGLFSNNTRDNNGIHKHVGINWTNFGNTPATSVIWYMCKTIIKDDIIPPVYKCDLEESPQRFLVIGPKQSIAMLGPVVSDSDIDATADEKKAVYVFGFLKYEDKIDIDELGIPKQRVTSFCQRIIKQKAQFVNVGGLQPQPFINTPNDNKTDESNKSFEAQISAQLPFVGVGCQNFDYCVDDGCKTLPQ